MFAVPGYHRVALKKKHAVCSHFTFMTANLKKTILRHYPGPFIPLLS